MLSASVSVRWTDAKRDGDGVPKKYELQFALPNAYHREQREHAMSDEQARVCLQLSATGPVPENTPVMIHLYAWRNADTGALCMYRAAHIELTLKSLCGGGSITMTNVKGEPQAVLTVKRLRSTIAFGAAIKKWAPLTFPPKMSTYTLSGGLPFNGRVPPRMLRDQVPHMYGMVPVWMLCQMYEDDLFLRITEGYLRNALFHSVRLTGFKDEREWMAAAAKPTPSYWEVLAKVCMFNVMWRPYLYDKTWRPGRGMVGFDQFSAIEAVPDLKSAAGDCEDDALSTNLTITRLHMMRYMQLKAGDPLRHLARLAHGFCSITVDVAINCDGKEMPEDSKDDDPSKLSLHHLAMLVPWSTMARLVTEPELLARLVKAKSKQITRTHAWPTLSLEGTETSRGNCTQDADSHAAFKRYCALVRKTCGLNTTMKKAHVDSASMETFDEAKFYRQVVALYSPAMYRLFGIGMMAVCENGAIGVDWKRFVTTTSVGGSAMLSLIVTKTVSHSEAMTLKRLCDRTPRLAALDVSTQPDQKTARYVSGSSGVYTLVFREQDISDEEEAPMLVLLDKCGGFRLMSNQRVHVTNDFIVRLYQFCRAE